MRLSGLACVAALACLQLAACEGDLLITVPSGVSAGQALKVVAPDGSEMRITVPTGVTAGQKLRVKLPDKKPAGATAASMHALSDLSEVTEADAKNTGMSTLQVRRFVQLQKQQG